MTSIQIDRNDGLSSATAVKGPCRCATTANITLSGLQTIDGVVLAADDRVLVLAQTDATTNGIYIVDIGLWRRSADFAGNRDVRKGTRVFVTDGTSLANQEYIVTSPNPVRIGTDNIVLIEKPTGTEALPTTASRYIRRNAAGTAYDVLTAQQSANFDVLKDIVPGSIGQAVLASSLASVVWALLGVIPDANVPSRLRIAAPEILDADLATDNGWYNVNNGVNTPNGNPWLIFVEVYNVINKQITQTAHQFSSDAPGNTWIYKRSHNSITWSAWYKCQLSQVEQDARYCQFFIQAGDPGAVGAGAIWVTP
jgi:hypothetical protein